MAGTEVNLYGVGDVSLTALMNTVDLQRVTYQGLSLTNYDNDLEPAIAAGSLIENGGTLFSFGVETAILGWAGVAVGVAYIKLVPTGATPDVVNPVFTDTAPTWSDAKQGWYGTVASANHRYVASLDKVDAATYANKNVYNGRYGERPMQIETKVLEDAATGVAENTVYDLDVVGFSFTPTAILDVTIVAWDSDGSEFAVDGIAETHSKDSLFGGGQSAGTVDASTVDKWQVVRIMKATPGANKVTVRVAIGAAYGVSNKWYYRITCTAARGG